MNKSNKIERRSKNVQIVLAIGIIGMIASFVIGMFLINNSAVNFHKNIIGKISRQESISAKNYIYTIFEEKSPEDIVEAERILREYGFSERSTFYMNKAMGLLDKNIVFFLAEILFLCILIYGLFQYRKVQTAREDALMERINKLEQLRQEDDYLKGQNKRIQNFIENVAHQIKTPLSRVSSSLYIVEDSLEDCSVKARINECYQHLYSVSSLMKRLTDIGRLEAGKIIFKKEKIYMNELIEDVIRSCGTENGIVVDYPDNRIIEYFGDYEWLKEALINIMKNGLEHNKCNRPLEVTCSSNEDGIRISVRDYGDGISEQDIPNLFDRFYTPEAVKENHTGIGLNLSKLIVEGHFGVLHVSNHVEGGAIFHIRLPLYQLKTGKK